MTTIPLSRRAKATHEAFKVASSKVIGTLTLERMAQCFPGRQDPELFIQLQQVVAHHFNGDLDAAWNLVNEISQQEATTTGGGFIGGANELDQILQEAEARRERNEVPQDLWAKAADAEATVRNATTTLLSSEIETLRAKRLALQAKNDATYAAIAEKEIEARQISSKIKEVVADFETAMVALSDIDYVEIDALQARIIDVVPPSAIPTPR